MSLSPKDGANQASHMKTSATAAAPTPRDPTGITWLVNPVGKTRLMPNVACIRWVWGEEVSWRARQVEEAQVPSAGGVIGVVRGNVNLLTAAVFMLVNWSELHWSLAASRSLAKGAPAAGTATPPAHLSAFSSRRPTGLLQTEAESPQAWR